jgi:hypothetical protein
MIAPPSCGASCPPCTSWISLMFDGVAASLPSRGSSVMTGDCLLHCLPPLERTSTSFGVYVGRTEPALPPMHQSGGMVTGCPVFFPLVHVPLLSSNHLGRLFGTIKLFFWVQPLPSLVTPYFIFIFSLDSNYINPVMSI